MEYVIGLLTNPFLLVGLGSWFVAQVAKTIIHAIINGAVDWERMFGDGGMPSGHSATVSSLAMMSALVYGLDSFEFAVTAILAVIVCHDAMGVRLETGKQALIINEIVKSFEILAKKELPEVKLKEFVGHTPAQVMVGITIGIVSAIVFFLLMY